MLKLKRFVAVFIATIMFLGNLPAYAAQESGAAAKSAYLMTEKRAFNNVKKDFEKSELGKLLSFTENIDGTYSNELTLEVKVPDVKTRKYVIKENGTYKDRYEDGTIKAYVEGEQVATVNVVANDNYVSLHIPELYEKYLTVDMNDLEGLLKKFDEDFDVSTLPKGIYYASDIKDALAFSKEEEKIVDKAAKKYAKLLDKELLKNSYFEKGTKQTINVNGLDYKCDVVSYKISGKELVDGFEIVWKEFKKDTELVNLLWNKIEEIYNLSAKMNSDYEELLTKEQVMGIIDTIINELQESSADAGSFKSVLYHQNGNLVRRDFGAVSFIGEEAFVTVYTVDNAKQKYYAICSENAKLEDIILVNGKETTHNFVITSNKRDYDFINGELVVNKVEQVNKLTMKVTEVNSQKYNIEFFTEGSDVLVAVEYSSNKQTPKIHDVNLNFAVTADKKTVEFNTRLAYEKDIKLNKINTKNNEIKLNEKTKEEMLKLFEENKEQMLEKIQGKFGLAFYYDEAMKTTLGIQQRMQNRADASTGAQIGKAVRVWFTDYTTDGYLNMKGYSNDISSTSWTKYSDLRAIDEYISTEHSTADGYDYYVGFTAAQNSASARIAVAVSKTGLDLPELSTVTEASVQQEGARVVYVEP